MPNHVRRPRRRSGAARLALEALEDRVVPSITIEVNYSMDSTANGGNGFFQNNPQAVAVMNAVAQQLGQAVSANLSAIASSGSNTWTAEFFNPETGALTSVANLDVPANTLIVYVGGYAMSGGTVGYGATGGYSWSGTTSFGNIVGTRNWPGFTTDDSGIWGGSIQFATNANWYFGLDASGLQSSQIDFYSVALHELGHVLGIGTSPQWMPQVQGTSFDGPNSMAVYGGPVPLASAWDLAEWQSGMTYDGQLCAEGPTLPAGERMAWTALDEAALEDVGWDAGNIVSPPTSPPSTPPVAASPPPVSPPPVASPPASPVVPPPPVASPPVVASPPASPPPVASPPVVASPPASPPTVLQPSPVGSAPPPISPTAQTSPPPIPELASIVFGSGVATEVSVKYSNGTTYTWTPFGAGYKSGGTVAIGDVTGSGYPDIIVASGNSGTPGTVQVYDGLTRKLVASYKPLGNFGGGLDVAVGNVADSSHDDIVVGVLSGGCPVVTVLDGDTGKVIDQFMAYSTSFLGGIRVGVGDVNGDGYADIVVGPGAGEKGMAVRVFSGESAATGSNNPQLLGSFVPFGANYTGVVSVAAGNLTSTTSSDIVVGSQSSGQQVEAYTYSGTTFTQAFKQNAFAGSNNAGVRVALVPDASGDGYDNLVVTNGPGTRTALYIQTDLTGSGWPTSDAEFFTPVSGVTAPVYVG